MNRRDFTRQLTTAIAAGAVVGCKTETAATVADTAHAHAATAAPDVQSPEHEQAMEEMFAKLGNDSTSREMLRPSKTRRIAMLAYPGMFPLDLVGPHSVLSGLMNTKVDLVWKDTKPIMTTGITVVPSATLDETPTDLDVLFVPGGGDGTVALMQDEVVLRFLADRGARAKYVCSVCTGSLVLGAAGLLEGYRATTHWVTHEVLPLLGATSVKERVVIDRNRITAAGVSAGIDFALVLSRMMSGEPYAKMLQLNIEYDPQPPFNAGSPSGAGADITAMMTDMYQPLVKSATAAAVARKVS